MLNYQGWFDMSRRANKRTLAHIEYSTANAMWTHDPSHKDVAATLNELVTQPLPSTVLSLGEGHHPRVWPALDAWAKAGMLDNGTRNEVICVDPMYENPYAVELYIEELSTKLKSQYGKFLGDLPFRQTDEFAYTSDRLGLTFTLNSAKFPPSQYATKFIPDISDRRVWLNIVNLLNYVPWEPFRDYLQTILPHVDVATFANRVNVDQDLIDSWMDKDRLLDNRDFIELLESAGMETIMQLPAAQYSDDMGAVFRRNISQVEA